MHVARPELCLERNLRFDLGQRNVLLVFDEAQHLSIACLETPRELLDQPPHCGLLFASTHELEQWRSRFHARPGLARHFGRRSRHDRAF